MGKTLIIKGADFSRNALKSYENITSLFQFTDGKGVDSSNGVDNGKLFTSSVSSASNFVNIEGYTTIKAVVVYYNKQKGNGGISFYTSNSEESVIAGAGLVFYDAEAEDNTMKEQIFSIPENAKYIRLTVLTTLKEEFSAFALK